MKINLIKYSSHFATNFQKLPSEIQEQAQSKEKEFRFNCFSHKLNTSYLKDNFTGLWSFEVTSRHSILFEFHHNKHTVGFIDIADHQIYKHLYHVNQPTPRKKTPQ